MYTDVQLSRGKKEMAWSCAEWQGLARTGKAKGAYGRCTDSSTLLGRARVDCAAGWKGGALRGGSHVARGIADWRRHRGGSAGVHRDRLRDRAIARRHGGERETDQAGDDIARGGGHPRWPRQAVAVARRPPLVQCF